MIDNDAQVNPYSPPSGLSKINRDSVCNFCGKRNGGRPLVQAPNQDVFICGSCAKTASQVVDDEQPTWLWGRMVNYLGFGLFLIIVPLVNLLSRNDQAGMGWLGTLISVLVGATLLYSFFSSIVKRV